MDRGWRGWRGYCWGQEFIISSCPQNQRHPPLIPHLSADVKSGDSRRSGHGKGQSFHRAADRCAAEQGGIWGLPCGGDEVGSTLQREGCLSRGVAFERDREEPPTPSLAAVGAPLEPRAKSKRSSTPLLSVSARALLPIHRLKAREKPTSRAMDSTVSCVVSSRWRARCMRMQVTCCMGLRPGFFCHRRRRYSGLLCPSVPIVSSVPSWSIEVSSVAPGAASLQAAGCGPRRPVGAERHRNPR